MHRCCTIESWAAVAVVYFVDLFVQIGIVEESVGVVAHCFVVHEQSRDGSEKVEPAVFADVCVESIFT